MDEIATVSNGRGKLVSKGTFDTVAQLILRAAKKERAPLFYIPLQWGYGIFRIV